MAFITWGPALKVGVTEIDRQHERLVSLLNRLSDAMAAGKGRTVLARTFEELIEYTQEHFATEELLMQKYLYPNISSHQAEHRALTKRVLAFKHEFDEGNATLTISLLEFLSNWLSHHILETDKRFAQALNEKGVR